MAEHLLRFRSVESSEMLAQESVLQKDPNNLFLVDGDRPEPYRSQYLAAARMQPVFEKEQVFSPFIVNTPRGQGLIWRWWPDQVGVALFKPATTGNGFALEERITFLDAHEREQVTLDFTRIVLNPPHW